MYSTARTLPHIYKQRFNTNLILAKRYKLFSFKDTHAYTPPNYTLNKNIQSINIESPISSNSADDILDCTISTLPNGVTVVSKHIDNSSTATTGVFIKTGSRAEVNSNNGVAHFLEHLAFKGTRSRSKLEMEQFFENNGCHLNAYTSRENTVYFSHTLKEHLETSVDIIADIITNSKFEKRDIENERDVIIRESEFVDSQYDEVVFDHLHSIIFKESSLGFPILGPIKNIKKIDRQEIKSFTNQHYKGNRMVVVAVGCVDHLQFSSIVEKYFGKLPKAEDNNEQESKEPLHIRPTEFFSGEKKIQKDEVSSTNIAIALKSASWSSPDYFKSILAQSIVGNWNKSDGHSTNSSSQLAQIAASGNNNMGLAESYMSFSTTYGDVGIWGIYIVCDSNQRQNPETIIKEVMSDWKRLANGEVSDYEFEKCKALLISSLVLSLDGTTALFEEIGRQVCTNGKTYKVRDIVNTLENVSKEDVIDWCRKSINKDSPLAIVSFGQTQNVPSLEKIKSDLYD